MMSIKGDDRFKTCIVWTYIPVLTTILPLIGHVGVGNSEGITFDFAGSYFVSRGKLGFNRPYKVYKLNCDDTQFNENWDIAITETSMEYSQLSHNLLCNNCHHFVAKILNKSKFNDKTDWTATDVFTMSCKGYFLGRSEVIKTWLPLFIITVLLICAITIPINTE